MHNHGNLYNDCATVILVNIMLLIRLPLVTIRSFSSGDARFVEKMRLLDYWKLHDTALLSEFPRSNLLLMVDRRPLVLKEENSFRLISNTYLDLKKKLGDYGVPFDITSSCLLDAVDGPSNDLVRKISILDFLDFLFKFKNIHGKLYFFQFQSLVRWSHIYRRCPRCASALRMRMRTIIQGDRYFMILFLMLSSFPFSPVAITLVTDHTDEYCMLVRHKGSASGVYTAVAGFAHVFICNFSNLHKLIVIILQGLPRELEKRQELMYIPPSGAIAHQMIRAWVEGRLSTRWQAKHERSTPF
uniref:Ubiquitin-like domain-containing protein n=1 Tax=Heterorhabditis bacteriophora TaxID=37862 RepID=A0A1I7XDY8_HETBA